MPPQSALGRPATHLHLDAVPSALSKRAARPLLDRFNNCNKTQKHQDRLDQTVKVITWAGQHSKFPPNNTQRGVFFSGLASRNPFHHSLPATAPTTTSHARKLDHSRARAPWAPSGLNRDVPRRFHLRACCQPNLNVTVHILISPGQCFPPHGSTAREIEFRA